jgi:hypothetical protein
MDGAGSGGAGTLVDSSIHAAVPGFNGCSLVSSPVKFGAQSLLISTVSTSATDFIHVNDQTWFNYTTGDFTIEGWIFLTNNTHPQVLCYKNASTGVTPYGLYISAAGKLGFEGWNTVSAAAYSIVGTTTITTGAWHFVQGKRKGDLFSCTLDGGVEASVTNVGVQLLVNAANVFFGNFGTASASSVIGNMDEWRMTQGFCRPDAVPNGPFPAHGL